MPRASTANKISGRSLSEIQEKIASKRTTNGNGNHPDVTRICVRCNLGIPPNDPAVIFCDDGKNPEIMHDDHFRHEWCFRIMVLDRPHAFGFKESPSDEQIEGLLKPYEKLKEYNLLTSKVFPPFISAYPIENKISV